MSDQISKIADELKRFRNTSKSKKYPKSIKQDILKLLDGGAPINELALKFQIHQTTLTGWRSQSRTNTKKDFEPIQVLDDSPQIKVTIISGFKLNDLHVLFQCILPLELKFIFTGNRWI